ncbi:uncharacterized protein LOC129756778 [Uranotaenia lowii]|uniref:uncharacterized protein LOC129756778 n=1 Tax=Uranotaenia lowii TaxID=190385 RepID=UPI0024790745|nr:uncharacterized protein LOC129756778 [Uranotaenia lowii]
MSSSDESEDENIKKCMEAVDTSLIYDAMFKGGTTEPKKSAGDGLKSDGKTPTLERPKSNRYLDEAENVFQSDINVTDSMKAFIGKKLSGLINSRVEFVETESKNHKRSKFSNKKPSVKLLRGFDQYIKFPLVEETLSQSVTKKPIIKRSIEEDPRDEKSKLKSVVVDKNFLECPTYEKCYKQSKSISYNYKQVGVDLQFQEPVNEFTDLKRSNNWDESSIRNFKRNKHKKIKSFK